MTEELKIDFAFACRDDCLDRMVPSDLRALVKERDALRAQLTSKGGEAVAWHTEDHLTDKSATTYDPEVAKRWRAKGWPVTPLYTHPADQVADGVAVSRELLELLIRCRKVIAHEVESDWPSLDELIERIDALLNGGRDE